MADNKLPQGFLDELRQLNQLATAREQSPAAVQQALGLDSYGVAANNLRERDPAAMGEDEQLLHSGNFDALVIKYGAGIARQMLDQYARAGEQVYRDGTAERSWLQAGRDLAIDAPMGAVNTVLGLGALGGAAADATVGGIFEGSGTRFAEGMRQANEWSGSFQSDSLAARNRLAEARNAATEREHAVEAEAQIAAGTPAWWAGTKQIAKDAVSSAGELMSDPQRLGQFGGQAIGSMYGAGVVSKSLSKIGTAAMTRGATKVLGEKAATGTVEEIAELIGKRQLHRLAKNVDRVEGASWMAAVGATESGGSYQSAALEVMQRTPEQLAQTSEAYRHKVTELLGEGLSQTEAQEQAQQWLANDVGLAVAARVAPFAAGLGLIGKGGSAPTKIVRSYLKDVAGEPLEEGGQGLVSQLLQNAVVQGRVDPSQKLAEGVGRQIGEGAVAGGLSAGSLKTPGLVFSRESGNALKKAEQGVRKVAEKIRTPAVKESSAEAELVKAGEALLAPAASVEGSKELDFFQSTKDMEALNQAVNQLVQGSDEDRLDARLIVLGITSSAHDGAGENRIGRIVETAKSLLRSKDPEKQIDLAMELHELIEPLQAHQSDPAFLKDLDPESAKTLQKYTSLYAQILKAPTVVKAMEQGQLALAGDSANQAPVTVADLEGPTGKRQVLQVVAQAEQAPGEGEVASVEAVLQHHRSGKLELTPAQKQALEVSQKLIEARVRLEKQTLSQGSQIAEEIREQHLGQRDTNEDQVGREITIGMEGEGSGESYSARQHLREVINAAKAGNLKLARAQMGDMRGFVQHMQNKVEALNRYFRDPSSIVRVVEKLPNGKIRTHTVVPYDQRLPDGTWARSDTNPRSRYKGAFVNVGNARSIANAQRTALEARFLHDLFTSLAEAFPELGVKAPALVELDAALHGDPAELVGAKAQTPTQSLGKKPAPKPNPNQPSGTAEQVNVHVEVGFIGLEAFYVDPQGQKRLLSVELKDGRKQVSVEITNPQDARGEFSGGKHLSAEQAERAVDKILGPGSYAKLNGLLEPAAKLNRNDSKLEGLAMAFLEKELAAFAKKSGEVAAQTPKAEPGSNRAQLVALYQKLSPKARLQRFYRDTNTGALLERGFVRLPHNPKRTLVAHVSVEGIKHVNDTRTHEEGDAVYRITANALHTVVPDLAKIGGDFAFKVRNQEQLDKVLAKVNATPALQGLMVTGAVGKTFQEAGRAHGIRKASLEAAGKRAKRAEKPLGLTEGTEFKMPARVEKELPRGLQQAFDALTPEEQAEIIFFEPESGLLTNEGLRALPVKKHRLSMDLDWLRRINDLFGIDKGDEILAAVGQAAAELGAEAHDVAHVSGDEFRGQGNEEGPLRAFAEALQQKIDAIPFEVVDQVTGEEMVLTGVGLSFAIGATDVEADEGLNRAKQQREADGLRGEKAQAKRLAGRGGTDAQGRTEAGVPGGQAQEVTPSLTEEQLAELEEVRALEEAEAFEEEMAQRLDPEEDLASVEQLGEAQPEAAAAPEVTHQTVAEAFPSLVQRSTNFLHRAFRIRKLKDGSYASRFFGKANPLAEMRQILNSQTSFNAELGDQAKQSLTPEIAREYQKLLKRDPQIAVKLGKLLQKAAQLRQEQGESNEDFAERVAKVLEPAQNVSGLLVVMNHRLQTFLSETYKNEKLGIDGTNADAVLAGLPANTWRRGLALNLAEEVEGKFQNQPELFQLTTLAALHWFLTASQRERVLYDKDFKSLTGVEAEDLSDEIKTALNQGMSLSDAKRSLGKVLTQFWGVTDEKKADVAYAEGIPEAVAGEALKALFDLGMVRVETVHVENKEHHRFLVGKLPGTKVGKEILPNPIYGYPAALEDAVVRDPEPLEFYGDDEVPVPQFQLDNPEVKLGKRQVTAAKNMSQPVFKLNMPMVRFLEDLGEEGTIVAFGAEMDEGVQLNDNHRKSLESQNLSLRAALREFREIHQRMQARVGAGGDVSTLGKRFAYAVTSVNRFMMQGRHNPASSKLMRELLMTTWATLDLTDRTSRHYQNHLIATAQALGLYKLNKTSRETVLTGTRAALDGPLAKAIDMLSAWQAGEALDLDQLKAIFKEAKADFTFLSVHALLDHARIQSGEEDLSQFRTALYLEADGITNGPFNALGLLFVGAFNAAWVKAVGKAGLSFGSRAQTADVLHKLDGADLYQTSSAHTKTRAQDLLQRVLHQDKNPQRTHRHGMMVLETMEKLLPGVELEEDKDGNLVLTLDRGVAKNPLTVTVYGSGGKGIANKLARELIDVFYTRLSEVAQGTRNPAELDALVAALDALTGHQVTKDGTEIVVTPLPGKIPLSRRLRQVGPVKFTLNAGEAEALQSGLNHFFVEPMREGITDTLGPEVMLSRDLIRDTTQAHSIIAAHLFEQAIHARIQAEKEKDPTSKLLSREALAEEWKKLQDVMPLVEADGQPFLITKSKLLEVENKSAGDKKKGAKRHHRFNFTFDDKWGTPAQIQVPDNAGVAGVPYLTIGMGDGRMIREFFQELRDRVMQVYDGINLPIDLIDQLGPEANAAARKAWLGNPFQGILTSYERMLADPRVVKALAQDQELQKLLAGSLRKKSVHSLRGQLQDFAQRADQRQRVLKRVGISIDQMAGAYAPHLAPGLSIESSDPAEIATWLNGLLREEEQADRAKKQGKAPAPAQPPKTPAPVRPAQEVPIVDGKSLFRQLVPQLDLNSHEKRLLEELLAKGALNGYRFVLGTREEIAAYQEARGLNSLNQTDQSGTVHGFFSPEEQTIYVVNSGLGAEAHRETIVHELVHAATYATVRAHYDGKAVGEHAEAAIGRLENLLKAFLATSYETFGDSSVENARDNIFKFPENTAAGKAGRLNEFMAWTLANRDLVQTLEKQKLSSSPYAKLARISKAAYLTIKKMIWGERAKLAAGDNLLSNIRFNAAILAHVQPSLGSLYRQSTETLFHAIHGDRVGPIRIQELRETFGSKVVQHIDPLWIEAGMDAARTKVGHALRMSVDLATEAQSLFRLAPEEVHLFGQVVAAMATDNQIDPGAMGKAQELYAHFIQTARPEIFRKGETTDPNQIQQASDQYDFLLGRGLRGKDEQGRSSLLPVFLGLALVSEDFRTVLSGLGMPKNQRKEGKTLDAAVVNAGNAAIDSLSNWLVDLKKPAHVREALDQLGTHITRSVLREHEEMEEKGSLGGLVDAVNEAVVAGTSRLGDAAAEKGRELAKSDSGTVRGAGVVLKALGGLASEREAKNVAMELTTFLNKAKVGNPIRELFSDFVGRKDDESAPIYDMVKQVRTDVQQIRQNFRDKIPEVVRSQFQAELTPEQNHLIYRLMGRFDLASLLTGRNSKDVLKLVTDRKAIVRESARLEGVIQQEAGSHWNKVDRKIDQLVSYMQGGPAGASLLRNAYAIAQLLGERVPKRWKLSREATVAIDQLVTLRLLAASTDAERKAFAELVEQEAEGMDFVLHYLEGQRKTELVHALHGRALLNHYKGALPYQWDQRASLKVDTDDLATRNRLESMGYVRLQAYVGSDNEVSQEKKAYYYAADGQRVPFSQGVAQTADQTAYGVHQLTGYSTGFTAGRIEHPVLVARLAKEMRSETDTAENLMPIFEGRKVVAFERSLDPAMLQKIQQDQDLAQMVGHWKGRQLEEHFALAINKEMVKHAKALLDADLDRSKDNIRQYINVLDPALKDPVVRDAVALFPPELRQEIEATFGKGVFLVRKDLLKDMVGYRNASIGDFWTGNSRWSPRTQKFVRDGFELVMGKNAYTYLVKAERNWQAIVSATKTNIVVRSVVVPAANLLSGMLQAQIRGIPQGFMLRGLATKTVETESYVKSLLRQVELETRLVTVKDNPWKTAQIEAELQSIKDSHRRLSIWPLIQAGEFSTVADVGLTKDDLQLTNGNIVEYLTQKVDQLPEPLREIARQGYLARGTSLYQGLQKATQYGDFLMKAIYFDHLTKKKGMGSKEALARITEEYNNYDLLPGRWRGYAESIGMGWFLNYKIRSTKIALSMLRNNPVQVLIASFIPHLPGIGTPISDNLFAKLFQGTLPYSFGPGMVGQGLALNPVYNALN